MTGSAGEEAATLWNRDFVLLWQGQLVSHLGSQAYLVALMFWTMEATGSASLMGALVITSTLPGVVLGPVAGTFVDRHSRKTILVVCDLLRGVAVLVPAALLATNPRATGIVLAALFGASLVSGTLGAVFQPAILASIPDLVPAARVASANSLSQLSARGSTLIGQALGGVLYHSLGAPVLFLIDGVSYLVSAVSESFIRLPRPGPAGDALAAAAIVRTYLRDTLEGLRFLWGWRGMRTFVLTSSMLNFLFMPIFVLLPFYVTSVLEREAAWYGFLLAAMSAGSLLGLALVGGAKLDPNTRKRLLMFALVGTAACMAGLGFVRQPAPAAAIAFTIGALTSTINIFVMTLVQLATPAELRGRVLGSLVALSGAATPLGMALGGLLGDLTQKAIPTIYALTGGAAIVLTSTACLRPSVREFLSSEPGR